MIVEADCIYVIPPNRYMTLAQGVLHLGMPEQPCGRRMAIDHFFLSLAHDRTVSIGIVLFQNQDIGVKCLLKRADLALYQAKSAGRNRVLFMIPTCKTSWMRANT